METYLHKLEPLAGKAIESTLALYKHIQSHIGNRFVLFYVIYYLYIQFKEGSSH